MPRERLRERLTHDEATLRDAVKRLVDNAFNNPGARSFASIPADPHRDADLIVADAIEELIALRAAHARLLAPHADEGATAAHLNGLRTAWG